MKKCLLAIVVVIAIILGGVPAIMGFVIEKQYKNFIAQMPSNGESSIKILSYKRGWFSSTAKYDIKVNVQPGTDAKTTPVTLDFIGTDHIQHGPVIYTKNAQGDNAFVLAMGVDFSTIKFADSNQADLKKALGDHNLVSVFTKINLNNSMDISLASPKLSIASQQAGNLEWKGMTGKWHVSADMKQVSGEMHVRGVSFTSGNAAGNLKAFSIYYKDHKTSDNLWVGSTKMNLPGMTVSMNGQPVFSFAGLIFDGNSEQKQTVTNSKMSMKLSNVSIADGSYGPAGFDLVADNLNAKALEKFNNIAQQINETGAAITPQQQQALFGVIPEIMDSGASIDLNNFNITTPHGNVTMEQHVLFQKYDSSKQGIVNMLNAMNFNMNVSVPKSLVNLILDHLDKRQALALALIAQSNGGKLPAGVKSQRPTAEFKAWVDAGLITPTKDSYTISVDYAKNNWKVNGKSLPMLSAAMPLPANATAPATAKNTSNQQSNPSESKAPAAKPVAAPAGR